MCIGLTIESVYLLEKSIYTNHFLKKLTATRFIIIPNDILVFLILFLTYLVLMLKVAYSALLSADV